MAYKMKYLLEFKETRPFNDDGYPMPEELVNLPAYKDLESFLKLPDSYGNHSYEKEIVWTPGIPPNKKNKGSVPGYRRIKFPFEHYHQVFAIKPPNTLVYDPNYMKSYNMGFDLNTLEDWNKAFLLIYSWFLIRATHFYRREEAKAPQFGFNRDWAIFGLIDGDRELINEFGISYIEDSLAYSERNDFVFPNRSSVAYDKLLDILDIAHNDVAINAIASTIKKDVKKDISKLFVIKDRDLRNAVANKLKIKLDQNDIDAIGSLKDIGIF